MTLIRRANSAAVRAYAFVVELTARLNHASGPFLAVLNGYRKYAHNTGDNVSAFTAENTSDVLIVIANC